MFLTALMVLLAVTSHFVKILSGLRNLDSCLNTATHLTNKHKRSLIIIGSAFSTIVNSVVENLLMPPLGLLLGNVDFTDLYIVLKQGEQKLPPGTALQMARDAGAVTFNYGQFLTDLVSFLILALGVFFIVKSINSLQENISLA